MIQAILFDLDGTLLDINRKINPIKAGLEEKFGYVPDDERLDNSIRQIVQEIATKNRTRLIKAIWKIGSNFGMSFFENIWFLFGSWRRYRAQKNDFKLIEGAKDTLNCALMRFSVGIVTSATEKEVMKAIQKIPILRKVKVIISLKDTKRPKPAPDPIVMACKRLDIEPKKTIYIGDLPVDIISGKSAGTKTMSFLGEYGKYTEKFLSIEKPDYMITDHKMLLDFFESLNEKNQTNS